MNPHLYAILYTNHTKITSFDHQTKYVTKPELIAGRIYRRTTTQTRHPDFLTSLMQETKQLPTRIESGQVAVFYTESYYYNQ